VIDDGDNQAKQEYVKKEFFARPYVSPNNTEADVKALTTKNSRYAFVFELSVTVRIFQFYFNTPSV